MKLTETKEEIFIYCIFNSDWTGPNRVHLTWMAMSKQLDHT